MPKKLTHEEFMKRFYAKNPNAENIEILEQYKGNAIKIKCRCKKDGYTWEIKPNDLISGHGCPKCSGNIRKTTEEFINELKEVNGDIEVLGEYVNNKTKIKVKCRVDGYIWEMTPKHLLHKHGCPKCYNDKRGDDLRKTHEQFVNELKAVNNNVEILGEYIDNKTKIKVKCKKCNHTWNATPNNLLTKCSGCPKCNISKGEKRIAKYLDNRNIKYIHDKGYFKDLKNSKNNILRPDFIIKDRKIWIEFDGKQHFEVVDFSSKNQELAKEQFEQIKENDKIKNEYAKKHNWKLIRIPYTEYDNIEKILEKELEGV